MVEHTLPADPTGPDLLRTASEQFRAMVALVTPEQLELPTPCPEWNVLELIGHVIAGSQLAAAIAAGASRNEAIGHLTTDFVGDDPNGLLSAVDTALDLQLEGLADPELADRVCQHPAGDMPGSQVLGLRIGDLLVHQWDLATAIGVTPTLDASVVQRVWDDTAPMEPIIAQLGVFGDGPSGALSDAAPLAHRLLDLMGRRPALVV